MFCPRKNPEMGVKVRVAGLLRAVNVLVNLERRHEITSIHKTYGLSTSQTFILLALGVVNRSYTHQRCEIIALNNDFTLDFVSFFFSLVHHTPTTRPVLHKGPLTNRIADSLVAREPWPVVLASPFKTPRRDETR